MTCDIFLVCSRVGGTGRESGMANCYSDCSIAGYVKIDSDNIKNVIVHCTVYYAYFRVNFNMRGLINDCVLRFFANSMIARV